MQEMAASLAPKDGSPFVRSDAIRWFENNYPKVKRATITAHLTRMSTNAPSRLHHNIKSDDDLLFQIDRNTFRRYSPQSDPTPIHDKPLASAAGDAGDGMPPDANISDEFAYEKDLQNYLSKNLCLIATAYRYTKMRVSQESSSPSVVAISTFLHSTPAITLW